jgi:hypothetical protein
VWPQYELIIKIFPQRFQKYMEKLIKAKKIHTLRSEILNCIYFTGAGQRFLDRTEYI